MAGVACVHACRDLVQRICEELIITGQFTLDRLRRLADLDLDAISLENYSNQVGDVLLNKQSSTGVKCRHYRLPKRYQSSLENYSNQVSDRQYSTCVQPVWAIQQYRCLGLDAISLENYRTRSVQTVQLMCIGSTEMRC
jgi:hypothetical protein